MNEILRRLNEAEKLIDIYEKYYDAVDITTKNNEEYFYFKPYACASCIEYFFEHPNGIELGKDVFLNLKSKDLDLGIDIYFTKECDLNLRLGKISRYSERWISCGGGSSCIRTITRINNLDIKYIINFLQNCKCNSYLLEAIEIDLRSKQSMYDRLRERIKKCRKIKTKE